MTDRWARDGMVALVTGAGSGIGRASAQAFAAAGARVVVADVDADGAAHTADLIRGTGAEAMHLVVDVGDASAVQEMVRAAVASFGRLDAAHNNAGIGGQSAPTADATVADFDRVVAINLRGVWLAMKYEIAQMVAAGNGGAIVNTASVGGLIGIPGGGAYTASKHGILGLTKTAALEYATQAIRVNAVCPSLTDTPMIRRQFAESPHLEAAYSAGGPSARMGRAEETANAAVWLCSPSSSFVNGVGMPIDGGWVAE